MGLLSSLIGLFDPIVGAAGDLLDTLTDSSNKSAKEYNSNEAQLNRDFQNSQRLATQQWNEDMWNKNNEYNSPKQQVQRALDAGVNPSSLFNGGTKIATSQPISSSPMSGSQASLSQSSLANSLLSFIPQLLVSRAQARNLDSVTDLNTYQLSWNTMTEKERYNSLVNMNDKSKAEITKIFSDVGVNDFNSELQTATFSYFAQKSDEEIKLLKEQLNLLRNQNLDVIKGIELKDAQIAKTSSDILLQEKQGELLDAQTLGQKSTNELQSLMVEYSNITGIPVGAPESHALFTLWQQGRFDELCDKLTINDYTSPVGASQIPMKMQAGDDLEERFKHPRHRYKSHYWDNWRNHKNPTYGTRK